MANIFIKSDDRSEYTAELLETYIRVGTVHNISVHEKNADFCVILNIPPYPESERVHAYFYNNDPGMEELASRIYYQFSKAEVKTLQVGKRSIPRPEYDAQFIVPTLTINLTNDTKEFDEEKYAVAIGQGIVSYLDPSAVFSTFSYNKKDRTVKKPQDKRYTDRKFIGEPTSNSKLLFKKN